VISFCPHCNTGTLSSSVCMEHGSHVLFRADRYTAHVVRCVICGAYSPDSYLRMPYPSAHDGAAICGECIRRVIDPALSEAIARTRG
jgi:hypothetical protein